jgi:uncharacterized repeat protein (TIGR03803 family)
MLTACSRVGVGGVPIADSSAVRHVHPSSLRTAATITPLYDFKGAPDGAHPLAGLTIANSRLFGTTESGGANSAGTVFVITPSGTETVLYSFGGSGDGSIPVGVLIDVNGTLYGTTEYGGANGQGTVFAITPSGKESVIYSFKGGSDGANPAAGLEFINGTLYGTTNAGGSSLCGGGCGTVFSVTRSGKENVLHSFTGGSDGQNPQARLLNFHGALYGTTPLGGNGSLGVVFKVSPSGNESVLHAFTGSDGAQPQAGALYGTTYGGGNSNLGAVFTITSSGTEKVLHSFHENDGLNPDAALFNVSGRGLYGTTLKGGTGTGGAGTLFSITTSGKLTTLYNFSGNGPAGGNPAGQLLSLGGTLYGTTSSGGSNGCGCGAVYSVTL